MDLKAVIRSIPDYPKPGVIFRDVTTLFTDAAGFSYAVNEMSDFAGGLGASRVVGIEARGFIVGGAIAHRLGLGFVAIRKAGKLPFETINEAYELEYGRDQIEMHIDMLEPNEKVVVVDDLIATGGTAIAGVNLLRRAGADVVGASFIVDLPELGGSTRLRESDVKVHTLVGYEGL